MQTDSKKPVRSFSVQKKPAGGSDAPPAAPSKPSAWWQWVLVYPTLAVSLAGAIPTANELYRSISAGVPFGESKNAQRQQDLWGKNMRCIEAPFDGLVNEHNVQVDATICKSGDVLVRFLGPNNNRSYRWVPVERFETKIASSFGLFGNAHAQQPSPLPRPKFETVVCQWSEGIEIVVRRVRVENECFEERIHTPTGKVVSRRQLSCDSRCGPTN